MGTIQVRFEGICTHFRQLENPRLPVLHRVVLVNASQPQGFTLGGEFIPPHFASIQLPDIMFPLTGSTLRVRNPSTFGVVYEPSYQSLPNLTALLRPTEVLGIPSLPMILGENPALAACYFDVEAGTFSLCSAGGAVTTLLTIETEGSPILDQIPFAATPFPPPDVAQLPTSGDDVAVVVQNTSIDETNATFHFYLNYLTAQQVPSGLALPDDLGGLLSCPPVPAATGHGATAGPGCSNSNYP